MDGFKKFLSPVASGVAILAFFMPWASCNEIQIKGSELAKDNQMLWMVLIAPIFSIAVYSFFLSQKHVEKSRFYVIISSAIALVIMFFKYIDLFGKQQQYYTIKIQYGFILSVLAFIGALVGGFLLAPAAPVYSENYSNEPSDPEESPVEVPEADSRADEITANLQRLSDLRKKGLLTEEEFQEKRKALIEQL